MGARQLGLAALAPGNKEEPSASGATWAAKSVSPRHTEKTFKKILFEINRSCLWRGDQLKFRPEIQK